jgi:hypothetical protein
MSQAPWATKLPAPSQARAVGPAELAVRRRCPVGSRTTGVARRNEDRPALARLVRDRCRRDRAKFESCRAVWIEQEEETGHTPNMRYSGPQLLSSWLHGASAEATKLPAPSQARAVGPAELIVRRRCPVGSRTTGVATRNEVWQALARLVRESGRGDGAKLEAHKPFGSNEKRKQATRLTCATADPNCCHLGCTARRRGNQAASSLASSGRWAR